MPDRGSRAFRLIPTVVPPLAAVVLVFTWGRSPGALVLVVAGVFLAAAVPSAVHHAEVIAHRVGEPFGSLVLAVAVTTIEVGLIVSLMVASPSDTESLARDTVYAALMITCNGIVGISLLASTLRERIAEFNAEGATTALATVLTLATLTLVLPTFTTATPGPEFSPGQLTFAAVASIVLYACFVFVQTVRHRDYFLPPSDVTATAGDDHTEPPAARPARRGRVQNSFNLALGSAMASIGLTIPTIAVASIWLEGPLVLGLEPTQLVLLGITAIAVTLTVLPGRATLQEAVVHLVIVAAFGFLAFRP
jgi:Ca2+:H+ antiporter